MKDPYPIPQAGLFRAGAQRGLPEPLIRKMKKKRFFLSPEECFRYDLAFLLGIKERGLFG